jgi:hypothetical protein
MVTITTADYKLTLRDIEINTAVVIVTMFCYYISVKGVHFYGPKSEFMVSGSDCDHVLLLYLTKHGHNHYR